MQVTVSGTRSEYLGDFGCAWLECGPEHAVVGGESTRSLRVVPFEGGQLVHVTTQLCFGF